MAEKVEKVTVPLDAKICDCGHVLEEARTPLNGKRYTERRAMFLALMNLEDKSINKKRRRMYSILNNDARKTKILSKDSYRSENPPNTVNDSETGKRSLLVKKKRPVFREMLQGRSCLDTDENKTVSKESMTAALAEINRKILSQCQVWQSLPSH